MRRLINFFKSAAAMVGVGPQAICRVDGFDLSLEKKKGVLLTSVSKENVKNPASEDFYYAVKIRPNGTNPEYPAAEKESVQYYTVGLNGKATGYVTGTAYVPAGSTFKSFELIEEFDDGRNTMGHRMPPHHSVMLRAHFRDASGHSSHIALGGWVRKSERESAAWKTACSSPVMYI